MPNSRADAGSMPVSPALAKMHGPALRRALRLLTVALPLVFILGGCADMATRKDTSPANNNLRLLEQIAGRMPGDYTSAGSHDSPGQLLSIQPRTGADSTTLELLITQYSPGDEHRRRFVLSLMPAEIADRLDGSLTLLDAANRPRHSCRMKFHATSQSLVGETSPRECLFGQGDEQVGLLKEISFDGDRIDIGDRLINAQTGQAQTPDQVITFLPALHYSGWAGERDGSDWRVAREFTLVPGHAGVQLRDAAGMALGKTARLAYYRLDGNSNMDLLRLTITNSDSGEQIAEAWAEPGSNSIGLSLPDFQIGLVSEDER